MKSHGFFCVPAFQLIAITFDRELKVAKVIEKLKTNIPTEGGGLLERCRVMLVFTRQ